MQRLIGTLLGGVLLINAVSAQEPPARLRPDEPKGGGARPAAIQPAETADGLPPGAVARLGAPVRQDRTAVTIRNGATLAYSPDGRLLATADNEVRLWDPATGRVVRTLTAQPPGGPGGAPGRFGGSEMIRGAALAFAPDGKKIAAVSPTQITVWDTATGNPVVSWPLTAATRVMPTNIGIAYTPDGKALVAVVQNLQAARAAVPAGPGVPGINRGLALAFWDAASGKELRQVHLADGDNAIPVMALAMSPDGRAVAAGGPWQPIKIIELATGQVRDELATERPAGPRTARSTITAVRDPQCVRFAPDGRTLYTAGGDGEIIAHDLVTGRQRRFGMAQPGSPVHVSGDGKYLAARAADGGIRVYETAIGRVRQRIDEPGRRFGTMGAPFALAPDGTAVAVQDGHGVRFIDVATGRDRLSSSGHTAAITGLTFSADGRTLVSTGVDQTITWEVNQRAVLAARPADEDRVRARAVSADGKRLAEVLFDGRFRVTELAAGRSREFEAGKRLAAVAFAPDGGALVASEYGSVDGEPRPLRRWDAATGAPQPPIEPGAVPTSRLSFSPDGRRLVGSDTGGGARVWDWPSGRMLWQVPPQTGAISNSPQAAVSPDGKRIALSGGRGSVRLLSAVNGEAAGELEGHGGLTQAVTFAPDSRTLATGGADGLIRVWDVETGLSIHTLAGHTGSVAALAYSVDGTLLASGGSDASILLWDATKLGRPATPPTVATPELTAEQVTKYWNDLAAADAKVAYKAVRALAASPATSVPRLKELLTPVQPPEAARITELLADLDHNQYARRQKASEALAALGPVVRSALQEQRATASAEARQRIDDLLRRLDQTEWTPEMLRQVRAVEALERAGTPEARAVLEKLGQGAADALLTREARAALGRMK